MKFLLQVLFIAMVSFTILSKDSSKDVTEKKSKDDKTSSDVTEKKDTSSEDTKKSAKVTKKHKHKHKKKRKLQVKAVTKDEILSKYNITPESRSVVISINHQILILKRSCLQVKRRSCRSQLRN